MIFFRYLYNYSPKRFWQLMGFGALAAFLNTVFSALFNFVVHLDPGTAKFVWVLLLCLPFLVLYGLVQSAYYKKAQCLLHDAALALETGLMDKIRNNPLIHLEYEGIENTAALMNGLNLSVFKNSKYVVLFLSKGLFQTLFFSVYVFWLMPGVFGLFLVWFAFLLPYFIEIGIKIIASETSISKSEQELQSAFNNLVNGYLSLKISSKKRMAALSHFDKLSENQKRHIYELNYSQKYDAAQSQSLFLFFIGCVSFVGPHFIPLSEISPTTSFLIFLFGPFEYFFFTFNDWQSVAIKLKQLKGLEQKLETPAPAQNPIPAALPDFEHTISFENIRFSYPGTENTALHIQHLVIPKGKIVFVTGGNGGGKSTFLKILTGLYDCPGGTIKLDGKQVGQSLRQPYREMFASVFTDFHVDEFSLEGENIPEERVQYLLDFLGLQDKVTYSKGIFSEIALSSGQKKRLALLVCFLENKPIYVFDELAADQDPENRRFFYEVILPDLKKNKRTVFAVTHDDEYFDAADLLIRLEAGRVSVLPITP